MTRRVVSDAEYLRTVIEHREAKHNTSAQALAYDVNVAVTTARRRLNQLVDQGLLTTRHEYRYGHGRHAERYEATDAGLERNTQCP